MQRPAQEKSQSEQFEQFAKGHAPGILHEIWDFIRNNKKWWLTPIILFLLVVGLLVILGGTAVAPFIYTLF